MTFRWRAQKAAQSRYLIIDKTDSLILFRDPKYNVRLNEQDDNQEAAFALSRSNAIFTKHFQLKDTPAIQRLLYLMPLPISLVPIKMYSILADAVMEVCSQL